MGRARARGRTTAYHCQVGGTGREASTSKYENEIHQQREALADMALQSSFLRQHLDGEERNHDEEDQGDLGRTSSGSRGLRESDVATTTSEQPALSEVHNFYSCTFSE